MNANAVRGLVMSMLVPALLQASVFPYATETANRFLLDEAIVVSGVESVPLVAAMPAGDSVVTSTFDVEVTAVDEDDWSEESSEIVTEGVPQFALTVRKASDESLSWWGFSDGAWVELTGADAAEGKWTYQVDIDQTLGDAGRKVRYAVKKEGESAFTELKQNGVAWLPVGNSTPNTVTEVKLYGIGTANSAVLKSGQRQSEATVAAVANCSMDNTKLTLELDVSEVWGADKLTVELKPGDKTVAVTLLAAGKQNVVLDGLSSGTYTYQIKLSGTYKGANLASAKDAVMVTLETPKMTLEGNTIVLSSNAEVDMANTAAGSYTVSSVAGKKCHLKWTDANGKYAVMSEGTLTVKEGQPKNGMDSYESYVLGLDPTVESSKPYITSKQNDEADKFTFELGNVTPKSESETGVAVSYELVSSTDPTFATGKTTLATATENQLSCDLPSDKVTYYKIEINMK